MLLVVFLLPMVMMAQRGEKIRTVVIDAGHGGKDTGALGAISKEKDLNLTVALLTGEYIKKNLPDVKVIYTRERDVFVTLNERAVIANRNNADVFISIHCNSAGSKGSSAVGAETFVLGEHKNAANLEVAKKENSSILYEEDAKEQYGDFDLNSPEAYIALSLFQQEYLNQSLQLAANVQEQFTKRVGRKDRGVQQAGFLVLWRTAMPSILIELGFISNATEERFLASEKGQEYMASAIFRAFRDFKATYEGNNVIAEVKPQEPKQEVTPKPEVKTETPQQPEVREEEAPKPEVKPEPKVREEEAPKPEVKPEPEFREEETPKPEVKPEVTKPEVKPEPAVCFKVQFATRDSDVPVSDKAFAKVREVDRYYYNGAYRYTSGSFRTREEAANRQAEVRKLGFSDAFVVAFINGERATIKEAEAAKNAKD
ncbi:MAG: N-acetylmuramoyl-L-alanine amidase [Bacteroidales bacterium]|nr:N-acetylmuramoyl-L-alanine amidase [Bacteroidales bacterium]